MQDFVSPKLLETRTHPEHEQWFHGRKQPSSEVAARALALLDKGKGKAAEPGDELPAVYIASYARLRR